MRQTACLVVNTIIVDSYVARRVRVRVSDSMTASKNKAFIDGLGPDAMSCAWPAVGHLVVFFSSC